MSEGIWIAVISGMFGAIIGSSITAWLNHKNERKRIIYEKKFVTYSGLAESIFSLHLNKGAGNEKEIIRLMGPAFILIGENEDLRSAVNDSISEIISGNHAKGKAEKFITLTKKLSEDLNKTL